jgi:hypothetical protein
MENKINELSDRISNLENKIENITNAVALSYDSFLSSKAIQDVINISILDKNTDAKKQAIEYLENLRKIKHGSSISKTVLDEIHGMIQYLRHGRPLSPEERRERFHIVSQQKKPD